VAKSTASAFLACSCLLAILACTPGPAVPAPPATQPVGNATPSAARGSAPTAVGSSAPLVARVARVQGLGNILQIGVTRGYFLEEGVELRLEEFRTAGDALPALSTGDLDVASTPPLPSFFNAVARGVRLAVALNGSYIAPGARGYPVITRIVGGHPLVESASDLRGKRIAHPARGNPAEPALERMLAEAGLVIADVGDIQYMGFPEILAALGSGSMDAAIVPEPWGAIGEHRGLVTRVRDASEFIPGAEIAMIVFSEQFTQSRADAARGFAVAYLRASRDYADAWESGRDRDAVFDIIAESAHVERQILDKAGYLAVRRNGRVDGVALAWWLDWLVEHGYVPQKPDLASLIDHRFADYAVQTLDSPR
jgi:NitT/TauT family transport system substrate-binding protein